MVYRSTNCFVLLGYKVEAGSGGRSYQEGSQDVLHKDLAST
jgi:hypothetical protein